MVRLLNFPNLGEKTRMEEPGEKLAKHLNVLGITFCAFCPISALAHLWFRGYDKSLQGSTSHI